jgi:hypothetical protein
VDHEIGHRPIMVDGRDDTRGPELSGPFGTDTLPGMCRQVTCKECGKPTWAGCGAHVEQVLGHVPIADRCPRDHPAKPGLLARLLGR